MIARIVAGILIFLVGAVLCTCVAFIGGSVLLERQVRDIATVKAYCECLIEAHSRLGQYPARLEDLEACPGASHKGSAPGKDSWGHDLLYESRGGDDFILIAGGFKRRFDTVRAWALRDDWKYREHCDPFEDVVGSDRGWDGQCPL